MNAVVYERSSEDQVDINARHYDFLQDLIGKLINQTNNNHLRTERIEVKTGNAMIDQFAPWYFGVAFAFMFTYNVGFPDMLKSVRQPRHRRTDGPPRIETGAWVKALS